MRYVISFGTGFLAMLLLGLPGAVWMGFILGYIGVWFAVAMLGGLSAVLVVLFAELFQRRRTPSAAYIATLTASMMLVCGIWVGLFSPPLHQ